jgi:hypothetical protein
MEDRTPGALGVPGANFDALAATYVGRSRILTAQHGYRADRQGKGLLQYGPVDHGITAAVYRWGREGMNIIFTKQIGTGPGSIN